MKKHILLYNDNTHNIFLNKLIKSIQLYSDFNIIIFNKKDIDKQFINNNKKCLDEKRGGGYWLWKPYIINETLKKIAIINFSKIYLKDAIVSLSCLDIEKIKPILEELIN